MATIPDEVAAILRRLSPDQQRHALDFARLLERRAASAALPMTPPPGKPLSMLAAFQPSVTPDLVDELERAIEEGCEGIEPDDELSV